MDTKQKFVLIACVLALVGIWVNTQTEQADKEAREALPSSKRTNSSELFIPQPNSKDASDTKVYVDKYADLETSRANLKESLSDPEKVKMLYCIGVMAYEDPQPDWVHQTREECEEKLRIAKISEEGIKHALDSNPRFQPH